LLSSSVARLLLAVLRFSTVGLSFTTTRAMNREMGCKCRPCASPVTSSGAQADRGECVILSPLRKTRPWSCCGRALSPLEGWLCYPDAWVHQHARDWLGAGGASAGRPHRQPCSSRVRNCLAKARLSLSPRLRRRPPASDRARGRSQDHTGSALRITARRCIGA
jgi:hypothetical protein